MNRAIGITATVVMVAVGLWLFGLNAVTQANEPAPAPSPAVPNSPGIVEVAPQVLYFAPAEGRNIAMDEGMIRLRREGARVTYVNDMTDFIVALGRTWDMVVAVDIPEEVLDNGVLVMLTETAPVVMRAKTEGPLSEVCVQLIDFHGEVGQDDGQPLPGYEPAPIIMAGFNVWCFVERLGCGNACSWGTKFGDGTFRKCEQCCNNAAADCQNGNPVTVDCVRVANGQDPSPWAPKPSSGSGSEGTGALLAP